MPHLSLGSHSFHQHQWAEGGEVKQYMLLSFDHQSRGLWGRSMSSLPFSPSWRVIHMVSRRPRQHPLLPGYQGSSPPLLPLPVRGWSLQSKSPSSLPRSIETRRAIFLQHSEILHRTVGHVCSLVSPTATATSMATVLSPLYKLSLKWTDLVLLSWHLYNQAEINQKKGNFIYFTYLFMNIFNKYFI